MSKAKTKSNTARATNANPDHTEARAKSASADFGCYSNGAIVNVTARAQVNGRDLYIYGGIVEMSRERTISVAVNMLNAMAMLKGLTMEEREEVRKISEMSPLF